jgi:hypothetical protein
MSQGLQLPSLVIDNILTQGKFTACEAIQLASTCRHLQRVICQSTECVQFWTALVERYNAVSEYASPGNVGLALRLQLFKIVANMARHQFSSRNCRDPSELLQFSSRFFVVGVTNDREIVDIVANLPHTSVAIIRGVPHNDTEFEELRLLDAVTSEIDRRGIRLVGVFVSALLPESQLPSGGICLVLPRALATTSLTTQTSKCLIFYRPNVQIRDTQAKHLREALLSTWSRFGATRSLIVSPNFSAPLREDRPREAIMQQLMFVLFETMLSPPPIDRTLVCEVAVGGTIHTTFAWMDRGVSAITADDGGDEGSASGSSSSSSSSTSSSHRRPSLSLFRWRNAS